MNIKPLFFITGLPRSRTAWFSAFMTSCGYPCLHEGMNECKTLSEYKEKIKSISDSNTGLFLLPNPYPERPVLIIHRKGRFNESDIVIKSERSLSEIKGMHIEFSDINKRIDEIFKYLTGNKMTVDIFNAFKNLNITTMCKMNFDSARELINEANKQTRH